VATTNTYWLDRPDTPVELPARQGIYIRETACLDT
jgi:hypothetical protein